MKILIHSSVFYPMTGGVKSFAISMATEFANNGTAILEKRKNFKSIEVEAISPDDPEIKDQIELMKVDVEDHEVNVCKGATSMLSRHCIKHVVFEDEHSYPNEDTNFLESYDYKICRVEKKLFEPYLSDPGPLSKSRILWEPLNYFATTDPVSTLNMIIL